MARLKIELMGQSLQESIFQHVIAHGYLLRVELQQFTLVDSSYGWVPINKGPKGHQFVSFEEVDKNRTGTISQHNLVQCMNKRRSSIEMIFGASGTMEALQAFQRLDDEGDDEGEAEVGADDAFGGEDGKGGRGEGEDGGGEQHQQGLGQHGLHQQHR